MCELSSTFTLADPRLASEVSPIPSPPSNLIYFHAVFNKNNIFLSQTHRWLSHSWKSLIQHCINIYRQIEVIRLLLLDFLYNRPQRSCGKLMFLHLSVILFRGGPLQRTVRCSSCAVADQGFL